MPNGKSKMPSSGVIVVVGTLVVIALLGMGYVLGVINTKEEQKQPTVLETSYHGEFYTFNEVKSYRFYSNYSCYDVASGNLVRTESINGTSYDMGLGNGNIVMDCSNMTSEQYLPIQSCLNTYLSLDPNTKNAIALCFHKSIWSYPRLNDSYEIFEKENEKLHNIVCIKDNYSVVLNTNVSHCQIG